MDRSELDLGYEVVEFIGPDEPVDLTNCDREPIHRSGAIQPHGVLLAVRQESMKVLQVSANTASHLGVSPSDLLGRPLATALGAEPVERLRAALDRASSSGDDPLICHLPNGSLYELTWHRITGRVVVELEPAAVAGAVSMTTLFEDVRQAMEALETTEGVQALCEVAASEIRQLTGYDRVMVYFFHPDDHGEVLAEQRAAGLEPFLGLNYPASDIPRQARKLYLLNRLRVIADVGYEPVALLGDPDGDDTDLEEAELDLSLSGLRSVSPFHLDYLQNMGVQATLTISLMRGTRLWGMLACHHNSPRRIDAQLRAACRVLGQVFSLQLSAHESLERQAHRTRLANVEVELIARMSGAASLADALITGTPSPLTLTAADGMVARLDGHTVTTGSVPPAEAVEALIARLCAGDDPGAAVCEDLPVRFSELAPYATQAAGVLAMPVSAAYQDFVLWFRGELVHEMKWAGDPNKATTENPSSQPREAQSSLLSPGRSFETWATEVRGRCRPWLPAEIDAAQAFSAAIPELLLARARDHLADLAMHDQLTGLANRALFLDRTAQALARQQRGGGQVAMLFVDLDRFKLVNDTLGHAGGDNLLRQAAQRLDATVRDVDTVARIGGDEFVVLCEGISRFQAQQVSSRIVESFRSPFDLDGQEVTVTTSIGLVVAEPNATPAGLLHDADTAMYRAKHSGRDTAASFTDEMRVLSLRRSEVESALRPAPTGLRPALERSELGVSDQPREIN